MLPPIYGLKYGYIAFFSIYLKSLFKMYSKGYYFDMNVYVMLNLTGISNNFTIFSIQ